MKKQVKPPSDPIKIYVQAEQFRFADAVLRRDPRMNSSPEYFSYVGIPSIVLSAFASELYLKCLLALEGKDVPKTHNLKTIFKRLRGKTQNRLTDRWTTYLKTTEDGIRLVNKYENYDASDLLTVLADGSNTFDEIRYSFERTPKTEFVISNLPWLIRDEILDLKPEWKTTGPKVTVSIRSPIR